MAGSWQEVGALSNGLIRGEFTNRVFAEVLGSHRASARPWDLKGQKIEENWNRMELKGPC